jgi:hypothetical protein
MSPRRLAASTLSTVLVCLACAACGAGTPQADEPENSDESPSNDKKKAKADDTDILPSSEESAISSSKDPMVGVTIKDEGDGEKKAAPCSGADLPDLLASL